MPCSNQKTSHFHGSSSFRLQRVFPRCAVRGLWSRGWNHTSLSGPRMPGQKPQRREAQTRHGLGTKTNWARVSRKAYPFPKEQVAVVAAPARFFAASQERLLPGVRLLDSVGKRSSVLGFKIVLLWLAHFWRHRHEYWVQAGEPGFLSAVGVLAKRRTKRLSRKGTRRQRIPLTLPFTILGKPTLFLMLRSKGK